MDNQISKGHLPNLLVFERRSEAFLSHAIYQHDLDELNQLSREFTYARVRWEDKRKFIRTQLEAGGTVEPGVRTAELVDIHQQAYTVEPKPYKKLVVK